ncbi:MAG TPA: recombinase family protein [Pseudonocardiaceae bacterium]|jgi:DNA invertase Pin-like site-specific DNA recombinase|nr:recombinase family protein [Pseudonocardiaceae bacterium]
MYARISEDRQHEGEGEDRQLKREAEIFHRLGLRLVGVYLDNDITASKGKFRPDYWQMFRDLDQGCARVVAAWHTDRLHRNVAELLDYIKLSTRHKIDTHTVMAGHLDLSTANGRATAITHAAWAAQYSEHQGENIAAARLQAAENGRWQGGVRPFGFEEDGETIRPDEAAEIERACDAVLAGSSLRSQVMETNARGFPTTFGNPWVTQSYKDMLIRPRNAGILVHQGEEFGPACWDAIVSEHKWRAVVAILTSEERKTTTNNRVRWIGSGLYICGGCKIAEMRVSTSGAKRNPAYRCRAKERGHHFEDPALNHVIRDANFLDSFVEHVIVKRLERPDAMALLQQPGDAVDVAALRSESLVVRQSLEMIDEDLDARRITRSRWLKRNERMSNRLKQIEHELAAASAIDPLAGVVGANDIKALWFGKKPDRSDGLNLGRRRAILDTLISVTVLPTAKGRLMDGGYFEPESVRFKWKREE